MGNVIRRVLHLIREEYQAVLHEDSSIPSDRKPQYFTGSSLYDLLGDRTSSKVDYSLINAHDPSSPLRPVFVQIVKEMMDEVENLYVNISNQAIEHIHSKYIHLPSSLSTYYSFLYIYIYIDV